MLIVKDKYAGTKGKVVTGKSVECRHTTLHAASGNFYNMTTTFDWTGVSQDDIMKKATDSVLIDWRHAFKDAEKVDDTSDGLTILVSEMLQGGRPRMTSSERVTKAHATMSQEAKATMLALLLAEKQG